MDLKVIGDEIHFDGFLVARIEQSAPKSILSLFTEAVQENNESTIKALKAENALLEDEREALEGILKMAKGLAGEIISL